MKSSGLERALEAMQTMERGKAYSLRPEDSKVRLAAELAVL